MLIINGFGAEQENTWLREHVTLYNHTAASFQK